MNQRYVAGALVFVALLLTGMGYVIAYRPDLLNICPLPYSYENSHCLDLHTLKGIVFPLMELKYVLPSFLILFCIRADVFKLWWKFAVPFALFLLYSTLNISPEGSGGWAYVGITRTQAASFSALWLTTSSLMLIAAKTWRPKWRAYYTIPVILLVSLIGLMFAGVRTFFF